MPATTWPVLYSFRRCPYAMRARMGVHASGIEVEIREVVLKNKPDHMIEISPKATVPVLQLANGQVIDQSLDIMMWALGENDPKGWLPFDPELREQVNIMIMECDWTFKYHLDRYKYPNRFNENDATAHRDAACVSLSRWNDKLKTQDYLIGNHPCLADYAIFPFVRQFANVDRGWFDALPFTHLHQWLTQHLHSPFFEEIMEKRQPWVPGNPVVLFPAGA